MTELSTQGSPPGAAPFSPEIESPPTEWELIEETAAHQSVLDYLRALRDSGPIETGPEEIGAQ